MKWWPWPERSERISVSEADFVSFDLETGGLSPGRDDILSFGAVRMTGGRIDLGSANETLVRPTGETLAPESVRVHQLTPGELAAKPPIGEAMEEFLDYIGDSVLVGWHVELDMAFVRAWCAKLGLPKVKNTSLDVLGLYLAIRGGRGSHLLEELPLKDATLYSVARALGVSPKGAHNALGDAFLTAQVLQRFLSIVRSLRQGEDPSLAVVLRMAKPGLGCPGGRGAPYPAF